MISKVIETLQTQVSTFANLGVFKERILYYMYQNTKAEGIHDIRSCLQIGLDLINMVHINYIVERGNADYPDYGCQINIPLEYFELAEGEYKDYVDNMRLKQKLEEAERKRKNYQNEINTIDYDIRNLKAKKEQLVRYMEL